MKPRVAFISVVPSPYQRDLFAALAARNELELHVFYLEAESPDSPWPIKPLAAYESILPGRWYALGHARCHWNWPLPRLRDFDLVVMNTLMSFTAQYLMHAPLRGRRWAFWGERLQGESLPHRLLTARLHRAKAIVGIGSRATREYAARFPAPLSFDIPYHCELAPFLALPPAAYDGGDVHFLFCGQMIARKGLAELLAAFATLDGARLHLVGREAELPEQLAQLPHAARERIIYHGFQAPERLPDFFAKAHVFLLPSRYDGWGVVVNQALGAGRPIICSDAVGAGVDLVQSEVNGMFFPAGSAEALAAAMRTFIDKPARIGAFGQASRAQAAAWTPAAGAEKWVSAIQHVLAA